MPAARPAARARRADRDRLACVASHGAAVPRGQDRDPVTSPPVGRFGEMFPSLPACEADERAITELFKRISDEERRPQPTQNPTITAGFTYLGQFVDHDITFDPTSRLDRRNDPRALVNFRTPRFDLDSVYGAGPVAQPFLYDWERPPCPGCKLLVDGNRADEELAREDLPRNRQGRALIGDGRNDENLIVAQLHLLFIQFHNAVVDHLCEHGQTQHDELFERAQRIVRWHYQWIVVHEFLQKVAGHHTADLVIEPVAAGAAPSIHRKYYRWQREPFIPVEFSGAAYRFGHSMVRNAYGIKKRPASGPTPRAVPIFPDLRGFRRLPRRLVIDWERFFELPGDDPRVLSHRIDTAIVEQLLSLPESGKALPLLNLQRGRALGLPSGQDVACAMGVRPLSDEQLSLDAEVPRAVRGRLLSSTPLWYYILCEAAVKQGDESSSAAPNGEHLGPVGGRIVAEVLVGLLEGDPNSYLCREPTWRPNELLPGTDDFTMTDLIRFARPSG